MAAYNSTGKELRKSPKRLLAVGVVCVILLVLGFGAWSILNGLSPIERGKQLSSETEIIVPALTTDASSEKKIIYSYQACFATDVKKGNLILVNRQHATEDVDTGLVTVFDNKNDRYAVKDMKVQLLQPCVTAFNEMTQAFFEATGREDLQVISGYRTKAFQQSLYDADLKKTGATTSTLVAQAGHSEHETGLAIDVNIYSKGVTLDFDGTGDYQWLMDHCTDYGFILRYPQDKTAITEFSYEPWHFRYVGVVHAQYMKANHLCLEEYLTLLQQYTYEGKHLQMNDAEGFLYEVYSVPLDAAATTVTEVPVPAICEFTLSGDNESRFLVTVHTGKQEPAEGASTTTAPTTSAPSTTTTTT